MAKGKMCDACRGIINGSSNQRNPGQDACTCNRVQVRNAFALHASARKAGYMKDRRAPRGGTRNKQREYREEE